MSVVLCTDRIFGFFTPHHPSVPDRWPDEWALTKMVNDVGGREIVKKIHITSNDSNIYFIFCTRIFLLFIIRKS